MPRTTRDAVVALVDGQANAGLLGFLAVESHLATYRAKVGAFIGASGSDIAFLRNTGDGANTVARGLPWSPGDEIVLCDNEFGSNALPWLALEELGVRIVFVRAERERLTPDVLERVMTPRTRVVAVSWVSFADGYRHDLAALSRVTHAGGALFCVDAIQGLGAFDLDVERDGIDALYAGGAKWLLALPGVSLLYVAPQLRDRLTVRWRGWRDVEKPFEFLDYAQPLAPSGARFEGGTQNFLGIAALAASTGLLARAGIERIAAHIIVLTDRLVERLHERGATLLSPRGPGVSSGIVTFALSGHDSVRLGRELGARGFVTTFRSGGIRVSPHGHNTLDEVNAFIEALPDPHVAAV